MKSLEPDETIDRAAYLGHRLPPQEAKLDKLLSRGRVTAEAEATGYLTQGDGMQVEVVFDGEVQSLRGTGRAIISADVELGLIVFYEAESADSTKLKVDGGKALRFALLGKVEIRRRMVSSSVTAAVVAGAAAIGITINASTAGALIDDLANTAGAAVNGSDRKSL